MTRGGRKKSDQEQTRRCIATMELLPKTRLLRFVVGPKNRIVPDILGNLPGRGIWVKAGQEPIADACAKNLFARAAKQTVTVPDGLSDLVDRLMAKRLVDMIALARKSGTAISGYEKVIEAVKSESVAILLQAADGSTAQKSKIRPPQGENVYFSCLSGAELGVAFAKENVIHAALAAGGLNAGIVENAKRLNDLRGN